MILDGTALMSDAHNAISQQEVTKICKEVPHFPIDYQNVFQGILCVNFLNVICL